MSFEYPGDRGHKPRDFDTTFLSAMSRRVLIGDGGAMGTMLQAADLTLDDFRNLEGCNEILNDTRPDVLEGIHRAYFEAGADAVETNTFGCNLSNLGDYDIADRIRELAYKGTAIARGGWPTRWGGRPPTAPDGTCSGRWVPGPSCRASGTRRSR